MRTTLRMTLLASVLLVVTGCRSLRVEAGLYTPAQLTATAASRPTALAAATTTPARATVAASPTLTSTQPDATPTGRVSQRSAGAEAAVQTALDYFGAIERHDYPTSYGLWAKGGAASGQSYDEFAKGYADTVHVSARLGEPTDKGTGAARTVSLPVTLASVVNVSDQLQQVRHYQGAYVLQPDLSAGGAWRIASATVAEVRATAQPPSDVADPLALQRAYFDAIDHEQFARGYTYWAQFGQASGPTFSEFAEGFSTTSSVAVDLGQPQTGGAAGSSYAEVPVVIVAKQTDRTTRTYCGTYTDRAANVPPFDQLGWRIESARLTSVPNVEPESAMAQKLLQGACPTATPASEISPTPAAAACKVGDLSASAEVQGATGNLAGSIAFVNTSSKPCTLQGKPDVTLVDGTGQVLPVEQASAPGSEAALGSPVEVGPGERARVFVIWLADYCEPKPIPPIGLRVTLPSGQEALKVPLMDVRGEPLAATPRCDQPGSGSSNLSVGLFQAAD